MCTASLLYSFLAFVATGAPDTFSCPAVPDVGARPYPRIAVAAAELERLRAAYRDANSGARKIIANKVREADAALKRPLVYPPRGGQHNQWYQCDACQIALKTIDPTHHQCPSCQKVYSGEPYDDVMFSRTHSQNLQAMLSAAWAYAVTGEDQYARFAADVLLGYAARYRDYPYHSAGRGNGSWDKIAGGHLFEQTLTEASAMANSIAPAYDLICASGVLSDQQRDEIRNGLLTPMLESIGKNRAGKSNWQTWHNAALLAGGAVLGDRAWIERALSDPGNGFVDQMKISVSDDGMWYENSWGYHFYTLNAMIRIAEYARRLDMDVWNHPRLESMFTVALAYVMPDGRLPRFGDDVNTSIDSVVRSLEFAYHAYGQDAMVPFLSRSPTWDSVMLGRAVESRPAAPPPQSHVFPAAGHAIARTAGPKGLASVTTFGPYGGFHGHFDKLSFVFYGYGTELGVDPGRARSQAYRLPIHRNWYKATLAHNCVVVDRKSQAPASGRLLQFDVEPTHTIVVAQCDGAYDGVTHTRLLLQTSDYLLIFDDLQASQEHRFDWFYHNRGESAECPQIKQVGADPDADYAGMEYVDNVRIGATNDAPRVRFVSGDVTNVLTCDAAAQTELLVGDGVGASVLDRVPLVRLTRRGTSARFAVVLEPVSGSQGVTVRSVTWQEQNGRIDIVVLHDDHRDLATADNSWKRVTWRENP